ncbi:MAG: hypothetical protein ACRBCS_05930 [Cellvibrionaceae bacterium]
MNRSIMPSIISGTLLVLAIVLLPDQYLFSKTVPNSFWVKYFPLPFGAGWFITFIVLSPAIWLTRPALKAAKNSITVLMASVLVAIPISVIMTGDILTLNNILNQYMWVAIIGFPPYLFHLLLRWGTVMLKDKWLTSRSKPTPKSGAV